MEGAITQHGSIQHQYLIKRNARQRQPWHHHEAKEKDLQCFTNKNNMIFISAINTVKTQQLSQGTEMIFDGIQVFTSGNRCFNHESFKDC